MVVDVAGGIFEIDLLSRLEGSYRMECVRLFVCNSTFNCSCFEFLCLCHTQTKELHTQTYLSKHSNKNLQLCATPSPAIYKNCNTSHRRMTMI